MTKFYREPVKKIGMERRIVAMETQNPHCHPYGKLIKHVLVSSTLSFVKIFLNSLQKGNWDLSASRFNGNNPERKNCRLQTCIQRS